MAFSRIYLKSSSYLLRPGYPITRITTLLRYPIAIKRSRYGNINPFPIDYAFQPRLRGRLTLRGLTFLRKPWIFGEQVSHLFYRYSCRHTRFHTVHPSLRSSFNPVWNAPLPEVYDRGHNQSTASVINLSPVKFSAQGHLISELLRFL